MMRGQLVSVQRSPVGVEVASAVAAAATVIPVLSALNIDEAGSTLLLLPNGTTATAVSADHEAATVTLAAPLATALAAGDQLTVPDTLEVVATVSMDGEPIEGIKVPHNMRSLLPDRFEQLEEGVTVLFDLDTSGGLSIMDVLNSNPVEQWGDEDGQGVTLGPQGINIYDLDAATAERYDVLERNRVRLEEARTRLDTAEQRLSDAFSEIDILPDNAYVDAAKQQAIDAAAITAQQKADQAKADAIADAQGKLATARTELDAAIASGDAATIAAAEQKVLAAKQEAIAAAASDATTKANQAKADAIAAAASDATAKAAEAMTKATAALTAAESAQATADNAIRTYYSSEPPWADGSTQPDDVLGDMWYDNDDGQAYRWNGTTWGLIRDQGIGEALSAAQDAQVTADGKITAYYQPNEPLAGDEGDLWFDTDNGNRVYRRSGTTWLDVADARIAQQATALATVQQDITGLEGTLDGKSNVWVQAAAPTGLTAADQGDIWINNGGAPRTTKVWTGAAWIDADSRITQAVTDITKKITTYYTANTTAPTGTFVDGDLWLDVNGKIARWSGTAWVTAVDPKALANTAETNAKAFATTTANGLAKTLWSTALPGTTTAPQNSTWYQVDGSGKIIAVFTQTAAGTAATWVARTMRSEVIDNLDLGKLSVGGSATMQQVVINSLVAQLAAFVQADIGNLTVTGASNLNAVVAERIWGNIASFAQVTADNVLAGDIQAVWNIVAGGKIIAGDPAGARVEITQEGIRIYALGFNGLPYEAVSLINGKISFAVVDQTRGYLAGISAEGDVTGQTGSFGERLTYRGVDVVGTLDGSAAPGYMDLLPRGIPQGAISTSGALGSAASGEVRGIATRTQVKAGRRYRLRGSWLGRTSVADGAVRLRLRYTTDGSLPLTTSPDTGAAPFFRGYSTSVSVGGDVEGFYAPTVEQNLTVLLTHQGLNGSTAQKEWSQVYIEDVGPVGLDLSSGEGETPKTVYTTTWKATASRGYTKAGASIPAKENEIDLWYFGASSETSENAAVLFGGVAFTTDNVSENGRTIPQALNGATIHSVSFRITNAMWWNQAIRNVAFGNFAGSALPSTKVIEGSTIVRDVPEGSTVTVSLDPAGFTNGTSQIVTVGDKDNTLSGHLLGPGKFQGPNDPDAPLITFTYSR